MIRCVGHGSGTVDKYPIRSCVEPLRHRAARSVRPAHAARSSPFEKPVQPAVCVILRLRAIVPLISPFPKHRGILPRRVYHFSSSAGRHKGRQHVSAEENTADHFSPLSAFVPPPGPCISTRRLSRNSKIYSTTSFGLYASRIRLLPSSKARRNVAVVTVMSMRFTLCYRCYRGVCRALSHCNLIGEVSSVTAFPQHYGRR